MWELLHWEVVGLIAVAPEVGRSAPQTWRVLHGGHTEGVSGAAALMTTATGSAWAAWSASEGLVSATLSSVLFAFGFVVLTAAITVRKAMRRRDVMAALVWITALAGAWTWGGGELLASALVAVVFVQNVPAVVTVARAESADGVSLWSAGMGATEGALWALCGLGVHAAPLALYGGAQFAAQSTVGLIAWRRRRSTAAGELVMPAVAVAA